MTNYFDIKRNLIPILCIILTSLLACKKDKVNNAPFISFTIDGVNYSFTKVDAAKNVTNNMALFTNGNDGVNAIVFALSDTTVGNYSELNTPTQGKILVNLQFVTSQGHYNNNMDNTDPCNVTISNINSSYFEGYFSGTLVGPKKITNGKFKIYF